ncbi:hypothetical protein M3182_04630 [Mesobacillus maritimus]|uniref:hypothetical protein n=1 Tax=Mesobacillus maritimus TaxID=1643336 RepID=UPI00203D9AF1|nr:hypothetical protein [Mesobacillus maritimus]MCM3585031.1 hypothetical protein [Mesobacillus maritimus]
MKRHTDELIKEISDFLVVYLKSGNIGVNSFIVKANLNITQLEQLITVHFLLKDELKEYVRRLPILIRRFKTSTTRTNETYYGEVRGSVNWPNTVKKRLEMGNRDRTVFSCTEQSRNYYIKENLVLKAFIELLNTILSQETEKFMKYEWFADWKELKTIVHQIHHKNVYLNRVSLEKVEITDRMLQDTAKHRNPLYHEAAILFILYRRLQSRNLNVEEVQTLLKETFVFPDKPEVLFELYWAIQLVKHNTENAQLELLDGGQNLFASWKDEDYIYRLYHDSVGSGQLSFHIKSQEARNPQHPLIERKISSLEKASKMAEHFFGENIEADTLWSGRPDLLLEVYRRGNCNLEQVFIGEVKHTASTGYAISGLRELVDYMEFVKVKNGEFLSKSSINLKGILFVDHVKVNESLVDNVLVINHDFNERLRHLSSL